MKQKTTSCVRTLVLALCLFAGRVQAQSLILSPQAFVSTGAYDTLFITSSTSAYVDTSWRISWSIGQTFNATDTAANYAIVTQGVQQPNAPIVFSCSPTTSSTYDTVTIKGTFFTGATAVSFGDTTGVYFTVLNDSTIKAVVGNGASGNVGVATAAGLGLLGGFTYNNTPVISSVTPLSGPIGTLLTITGSNLFDTSTIKVGGVTAIPISYSGGTTLVAMVMPGATSGTIAVTNGGHTTNAASSFTVTSPQFPHTQQGGKLVGTVSVVDYNTSTTPEGQGYAVAISANGNTAIVGGNLDSTNIGAAWIYTRNGSTWAQQGFKLASPVITETSPQFGSSVALSADGNTAIIGGPNDSSGVGAAWIFTRSGSTWTYQTKLVGNDASNGSLPAEGTSVALSGDGNTAIVGGYGDSSYIGAAWIFNRSSSGVWTQNGNKLVGTGSMGAAQQGYAVAMSADGKTALVGGSDDNNNLGATWVFRNNGAGWAQQAKLFDATTSNSNQGSAVALSADGNTAMVGGPFNNSQQGAAWIYTYSGSAWSQQTKLIGTGGSGVEQQGYSVALSADGNTALSGGFYDNNGIGAVWTFTRSGSTWTQPVNKLIGTNGTGTPYIGNAVALSEDGTTAMLGGNNDSSGRGAAWVFVNNPVPIIASFTPDSAIAGEVVKITGSGFNGTTSVKFGGVAAQSFTYSVSNGDTSILATVGTGASGYLSVTNSYGVDSVPGFTFLTCLPTYSTTQLAICSSALPYTWNDVICDSAGTYKSILKASSGCDSIATLILSVNAVPIASISGTTTGCDSVRLTASGGTSYVWSGGKTPSSGINTIDTTGGYSVTVKGSNGCTTTINTFVAVNPLPIPQITGATSGCDSVKLYASGGNKYTWSGGNSLTSANNTITTSGSYTVLVTDTTTGCSASISHKDTINTNPVVGITGSTSGCDSVKLIATGGGTGASYSWSGGNTASSDTNTFVNDTTITIGGTYSVTVTNSFGCTSTASKTITIFASPTPSVSGNDTACSSVTLTASGGYGYSWSGGNSISSPTNTFTHSGGYLLTVTNLNNCSTKDSVYVTVNTPPTLSIQQASNGCGNVYLTANTPNDSTGPMLYNWYGLGANPTSKSNNFTASGTYTVMVTDSNGCTATGSQAITITVSHTASINNIATTTCLGTSTLEVAWDPLAYKAIIYQDSSYYSGSQLKDSAAWKHVDSLVNNNFVVNPYKPTVAGTYYAVVYYNDGCDAITPLAFVNVAHISIVGPTTGCQSVTLAGTGGTSYVWNGGTTPTAATDTFKTIGTQTVIMTGTDSNFCVGSDTTSITIVNSPPPTATLTGASVGCDSVVLAADGGATYSWNGGEHATSATNVFLNSGIDSVLITASNGCSVYLTKNVLINQSPIVYIPGYASQCGMVTLTAAGGDSYFWNSGNTQNTATNTFTQGGTNYVSVIGTSSNGCSSTSYDTITVNSLPTLVITGNTSSCDSVTLTASGGIGYVWSGGNNITSPTDVFDSSGSYTVTAYSNNGCTKTDTVTVNLNPQSPQVTIASTDTIFCSGTQVTFTATQVLGGTSPSFQWLKNGVAITGATNATYTYSPSNGDVITCRLVSNDACVVTPIVTSNPITETQYITATPSLSVIPSANNVCAGTNVTFTANPANSGKNPSYQWKINGVAVSGATNATYTFAPSNDDFVSCSFTSTNGCNTTATVENSVTMTVNANIVSSVSIVSSATSICNGTSVTFTASPSNSGSSPSYQWLKNGVGIIGANSRTYSYQPSNNDSISCLLTANNTCQTIPNAISNLIVESVTPNVDPIITIASNPSGSVCAGTSVTFTATIYGGTVPTYQWYNKGTVVGGATSETYSYVPVDGDSVYCLATANNTCQIKTVNSIGIKETVITNVMPIISIVTDTNNICKGTSVTFSAKPTNGGSRPTYQWLKDGVVINGAKDTTYSYSPTNFDVISCILTANNTCQTKAIDTSTGITENVIAYVTPSVSIAASANNICSGTSVTITATPVNPGSSPTYNFKVNGASVQNGSSATYTSSSFADGDVVTCVLTVNNPCQTATTVNSGDITLIVNQNLVPSVTISTPTSTIQSGESALFTATPTNGGASPVYQWKKNGTNVGTNSSTYTDNSIVNNDVISVLLTTNNTCQTSSTAASNTIRMSVVNTITWTGLASKDWNNPANWNVLSIPTSNDNIIIPSFPSNQPVLNSATTVNSIHIAGALGINGQSLTINGGISCSGTLICTPTSSITINGSATDTLKFGTGFTDSLLGNLTINGTCAVKLNSGLGITNLLMVSSGSLVTNNHLTLKSSGIANTALVGEVGGTITGNVTVERFIPSGLRTFRDIGAGGVANAGSIFTNWQENGINTNGYGIYITGSHGTIVGTDPVTGFDYSFTGNHSLYTCINNTWDSVLTTKGTTLDPYQGFRVLVRGDRTGSLQTQLNYMWSPATVRTTGNLITGTVTFGVNGVNGNYPSSYGLTNGANGYTFISNPYASVVDWESVYNGSQGMNASYWYCDPTITTDGTSNGYTVFVSYNALSHSVSNPLSSSNVNRYLQPGQAFFVENSTTSPSLIFTENCKAPAQGKTAIFGINDPVNRIAVGLYKNNTNIDGAVAVFNSDFSNIIGKEDAIKFANGGENLALTIAGKDLCINGYSLPTSSDVLPIHLYNLQANTAYTIRLDASQYTSNGVSAFIKDNVSNTQTLLAGDNTALTFTTKASDANSYSSRYSIVFGANPLPVKEMNVTAAVQSNAVLVKWSTTGENNVANYYVEHSTNGVDFTELISLKADNTATANYSYVDASAKEGNNYYRIKAVDNTGSISYSTVVIASIGKSKGTINTYPNPVVGNTFNLQLSNVEGGNYTIRIISKLGQEVYVKSVNHISGSSSEQVSMHSVAAGTYTVSVANGNGVSYQTQIEVK